LSFEIQELPDIMRVIVLLSLRKGDRHELLSLKRMIDKKSAGHAHVEMNDLDRTLKEMAPEGLVLLQDGAVQLTDRSIRRKLLLKKDPVIEVVAGLVCVGVMVVCYYSILLLRWCESGVMGTSVKTRNCP
jgi:hypothetical protein